MIKTLTAIPLLLTLTAIPLSAFANGPAPIGYLIFCNVQPKYCAVSMPATINLDARTLATIEQINSKVNASIRPKADKTEQWSINVTAGDCEDYALTKRQKLIEAGFPSGALRIAEVKTINGARHAVLVVLTDKGQLILDNLRKHVVFRQRSGYKFLWVASENPSIGR